MLCALCVLCMQAIEENVNFDVRANVYTLLAVTGVVLFWRGVGPPLTFLLTNILLVNTLCGPRFVLSWRGQLCSGGSSGRRRC